jgi:hypothetical protein
MLEMVPRPPYRIGYVCHRGRVRQVIASLDQAGDLDLMAGSTLTSRTAA